MAQVNLKNTLKEVLSSLNPRIRDVIEKRFGLRDGKRQTLESIGKSFDITRERVRQIEADGLRQLSRPNVMEKLVPLFDLAASHLDKAGGIQRQDRLFEELGRKLMQGEKNQANYINFLLVLGQGRFLDFPETESCYATWAAKKDAYTDVISALDKFHGLMESRAKLVSEDELLNNLKTAVSSYNNLKSDGETLDSYLNLSKKIARNPFGDWGLDHWTEISPRGVKDQAFLVFKREQKPLHFRQVASLINSLGFSSRKAHPQTVHNELIKDPRFILVGRGTYALRDWGYEPGTVRDVIISVMRKQAQPLTKEEIIKNVLAKRLVKENTILLNLQNRKIFNKTKEGKYSLV